MEKNTDTEYLVNLQLALRSTGMNLSMSQILCFMAVLEAVIQVGDEFTTKMAMTISVEAAVESQKIQNEIKEMAVNMSKK